MEFSKETGYRIQRQRVRQVRDYAKLGQSNHWHVQDLWLGKGLVGKLSIQVLNSNSSAHDSKLVCGNLSSSLLNIRRFCRAARNEKHWLEKYRRDLTTNNQGLEGRKGVQMCSGYLDTGKITSLGNNGSSCKSSVLEDDSTCQTSQTTGKNLPK